jgi:hypothetical protein
LGISKRARNAFVDASFLFTLPAVGVGGGVGVGVGSAPSLLLPQATNARTAMRYKNLFMFVEF